MISFRDSVSRSRVKTLVRVAALLVALGFLASLLASQWQALQAFQWELSPQWLIPSFGLLVLASLFDMSNWRFLLGSLGGRLRWRRAAETWFLSNLARFIPGNIWQFLGMAELAADDGVSRLTTYASIVLHQVLSMVVGLVLAALYFAVAGQSAWLDAIRPFLLLAPLGLLACHPRVLEWSLNRLLAVFKRPPLQVTLTWRQLNLMLLRCTAAWLMMGSGFALLAAAITPINPELFAALVATWVAAYVIGFLSLLTPSGLGVREGVMILLLAPLFPVPIPTVIALAARLWIVLGELAAAAVALASRGRRRLAAPQPVSASPVTGQAGDA